MKTILAVTHRQDDAACDLLQHALSARGGRLVRLNADRFPSHVTLDAELGPCGYEGRLTTDTGEVVQLQELHVIWLRRLWTGAALPRGEMHPSVHRACVRESSATLEGVLASLAAPTLNDMHAALRADSKPWQLLQAAKVGLPVPATLLTNHAGAAGGFLERHGPLITKMMSTQTVQTERGPALPRTSAVTPADLDDLEGGFALSPATLQARVPKQREARAIVVGQQVFASAVDTLGVGGAEVDWRIRSAELIERFEPIVLPPDLCARLVRLHEVLGLVYGAVDLVLSTAGEWVFLETNPAGEWEWIEASGHDIAGPLAALLLEDR